MLVLAITVIVRDVGPAIKRLLPFVIILSAIAATHPASASADSFPGCSAAGLDVPDLSGCEIRNLDLTGHDLTHTNLNGVRSSGLVGVPVGLPAGWKLIRGYLLGPGARPEEPGGMLYLYQADLKGVSLAGAVLPRCWCESADLSGVDLSDATIYGTFTRAKLSGADLTRAVVTGQFEIVDINGVNLDGTVLSGSFYSSRIRGISGIPRAVPSGFKVVKSQLLGPEMDLRDLNLSGADLSGIDFRGSSLLSSNVSDADFSGSSLVGILTGTKYHIPCGSSATCPGRLVGSPSKLPKDYSLVNGYLVGPDVVLRGANLGGTDLRGMNLSGATFLGQTVLNGADLRDANLDQALLFGVFLDGAQLSGVTGTLKPFMKGLYVVGGHPQSLPQGWAVVDLKTGSTRLVLSLLVQDKLQFDFDTLKEVTNDPAWPYGRWQPDRAQVFTDADLRDLDLSGSDLTGLSLENSDLSGADVSGSDLTSVDAGGTVTPTDSSVAAGSATGSAKPKFGVKLFRARLTGSNLDKANLRHAGLSGVISGGLRGTPKSLPSGWRLTAGYLVGPTANLSNANLAGARLAGLDLSKAKLARARTCKVLSGPSSLPKGWVSAGSCLIGPGADLSGAMLSNLDFGKAVLKGTKLIGSNLTRVKLKNAVLTGVISSGLVGKPASLPAGWSVVDGSLVKR